MLQITLAGRIGRDAELRATPSGKSVCGFAVAVDSRKGNEKVTTWVDCSLWEKRGEALVKYLTKGTAVAITGELSLRVYQKKDGTTATAVECRVAEITLLGGGGGERAASPPLTTDERRQAERTGLAAGRAPVPPPTDRGEFNDDIPF